MRHVLIGGLALLLAACVTPPLTATTATATTPPSSAAQFVSSATAMIGEPYLYGGAAPGGFDCSGLVVFAAMRAGFTLPRTAREQIRAGLPIARRDVRGGDLVFMRLRTKELHVGIAIDAEHFVNAPAAGGHVRIDSLERAPFAHGFLTARRVADGQLTN